MHLNWNAILTKCVIIITSPLARMRSTEMNISVCLFVCLSVRSHSSKTRRPNFTKYYHVAYSHGSALLCRRCNRLCISGFVDDLTFTARCTTVQSAVLLSHVVCPSVCPSVTLVDHDHIGWKSWKLILRTISPTSSLFAAQRSFTYSQGNMEKFWGD